jgi:hypothetical protein
MTKKTCELCNQKTDVYTEVHKKNPFVNGKNYSVVCFTCFFVPKILEQTYRKDGSLDTHTEVAYCCQNIHTPGELHYMGSSDTLKYARNCVEAVKNACRGVRTPKKPNRRPEASWKVC